MREGYLTPEFERVLNMVGMLGIVVVILGSFLYQFSYRELPCTLCLLQRVAMLGVAVGAAMNLMIGPDTRHYGVCLVSAAFGIAVSMRQSLLHINPYFDKKTGQPTLEATSNPPFGHEVFGLNMYIWGVVIFTVVFLVIGLVQLIREESDWPTQEPPWLSRLASLSVGLLVVVMAAQAVMTFMECGFGDCPNDGGWDWWIFS